MAGGDIQTPERGNINFFYRPETGERAPEGRKTPASGPVGEGVYRILKHKDHTHPVYSLELPEKPGEAQDIFRVSDEAGCIVIKNPRKGSRAAKAGLSQGQQADFPEDLQSAINGEDFRGAKPPLIFSTARDPRLSWFQPRKTYWTNSASSFTPSGNPRIPQTFLRT